MKVELLGVLEQIEITAEGHDRTSEKHKKEGNFRMSLEFATFAYCLRTMAKSLETIYSINGDK